MILKKKLSLAGLLYVILDKKIVDELNKNIISLAKEIAGSCADLIQLRAKEISDAEFLELAKKISSIFQKKKKLFLINDRIDIAYLSRADGIHLGSSDINEKEARRMAGKHMLIGKTIHSQKEIKDSAQNILNYVSLGPFFKSKTKQLNRPPLKSEEIRQILSENKKVLFAIGGINRYNIPSILEYKIKNIAVSSTVLETTHPANEIEKIKKCLKKAC